MTPFSQTLRAQEAEAGSRSLSVGGALVIVALLGCWLGWFFFAEVTLKAVTPLARLEASLEPHPVMAEIAGRVASSRLQVGVEVKSGEILVAFETRSLDLEISEAEARHESLAARLEASREELRVARTALEQARAAAVATTAAAEARAEAAAVEASFAEGEVPTMAKLRADGSVSTSELERAKADAASLRAIATAELKEATRAKWASGRGVSDRAAAVQALQSALVALEGALLEGALTLERHALERERHVVRAPLSGRLGEVEAAPPGTLLSAGEQVAVVVPSGALKLTADFPPALAAGRIHPGQRATMRLHGFPWLQYGVLRAEVMGVASELRGGLLRVELSVIDAESSPVPLSHGLPGDLEIDLERVSPAALTLRVAGRMIRPARFAAQGTE